MNYKLPKILVKVGEGIFFLLLFPRVAFAKANLPNWVEDIFGELISAEIPLEEFLFGVINWVIGASVLMAVVFLLVAGFLYITSSGDDQKIGKATKTLVFAIVGLVLCFISVLIVNFVLTTFLEN